MDTDAAVGIWIHSGQMVDNQKRKRVFYPFALTRISNIPEIIEKQCN